MIRMRRRSATVAVATVALAALGASAWAAWSITSTGSSVSAKATSVAPPATASAAATSSTAIDVSWTAPASGPAPAQYRVDRTAPTAATVCTVPSSTLGCTDSGLTASTAYSYSVFALIGTNWVSATGTTATATTSAGGAITFLVEPAAGTKTVGTEFSVQISAQLAGVTDPAYTGSRTLTFSGPANSPNGDAPVYPTSVSFSSGVGTAQVTLHRAGSTTLTVSEVSPARSGTSAAFTMTAGSADRLRFTGSDIRVGNSGTTYTTTGADCVPGGSVDVDNGGIFRSYISVTDLYGNTVANGGTGVLLSVTRSPSQGTLTTPSPFTIAANASPGTTASTFSYQHPIGNPSNTTLTASVSSGPVLTAVSCTITK